LKAQVIVYSRPGCHLCEELKEVILTAGCNALFTFEEFNIDTDPILYERYKYDIPVVTINGVERFMHRVGKDEFISAILETP
jgi:glutaredoxin